MSCIHLNTFVSRESDSKITNVCQSVIKTPKKKDKDFLEKYTPMESDICISLHVFAYLCISLESLRSQPSYLLAIILINHVTRLSGPLAIMPISHHQHKH